MIFGRSTPKISRIKSLKVAIGDASTAKRWLERDHESQYSNFRNLIIPQSSLS